MALAYAGGGDVVNWLEAPALERRTALCCVLQETLETDIGKARRAPWRSFGAQGGTTCEWKRPGTLKFNSAAIEHPTEAGQQTFPGPLSTEGSCVSTCT
jgi:hypothetical protein